MVRLQDSGGAFSAPRPKRLFYPNEPHIDTLPIQHAHINGEHLIANLDTVAATSTYFLKLEPLGLLTADLGHFFAGVNFLKRTHDIRGIKWDRGNGLLL